MQDKKLEMFFDKKTLEEIISISIEKRLDRELLTKICIPEFRLTLLEAIESLEYNVAPPRISKIPKDDGGFREVFVNEPMDRIVLSLINVIYSNIYKDKIHKRCVSYQKGIGVPLIIKEILGEIESLSSLKTKKIGYKLDISKYFDSLSKECLYQALDEVDTGSPIDAIVQKYYREDIIYDSDGKMIEYYKSIAQGCAVSPFLANYCLRDLDEEISKMDLIYYRYSDDILIIGKDADKAMDRIVKILATKGLKLNPNKIDVIKKDEWFTFLGFRINGKNVSLSKKSLKNFQREIKLRTQPHKGDEKALKRAIKDIQWYLYTAFIESKENFGWGEYFFSAVNVEEDIIELDEYVKDRLRGMYTGKSNVGGIGTSELKHRGITKRVGMNVGMNMKKIPNEKLIELGYLSMNHMYNLFKINKEVFRREVERKFK